MRESIGRHDGAPKAVDVPETGRLTNLGWKQLGERVNIERDSWTVTIVGTVEHVRVRDEHLCRL